MRKKILKKNSGHKLYVCVISKKSKIIAKLYFDSLGCKLIPGLSTADSNPGYVPIFTKMLYFESFVKNDDLSVLEYDLYNNTY